MGEEVQSIERAKRRAAQASREENDHRAQRDGLKVQAEEEAAALQKEAESMGIPVHIRVQQEQEEPARLQQQPAFLMLRGLLTQVTR